MSPTQGTENQASELMWPVLHNIWWNKNALEAYEAISNHAEELNANHGHFFGITQRFAIDNAIIGIYKIYDSNPRGYTIPNLFKHFKKNFDADCLRYLRPDELCALNIPASQAGGLVAAFKSSDFNTAKTTLCKKIQDTIPTKDNNAVLKKILEYRNKFAAHQDQVSLEVKRKFENLPSLADVEVLNDFAQNFCRLFTRAFTIGVIIDSVTFGYAATCDVIAKTLDKNFEDPNKTEGENYQERERFYSHTRPIPSPTNQ